MYTTPFSHSRLFSFFLSLMFFNKPHLPAPLVNISEMDAGRIFGPLVLYSARKNKTCESNWELVSLRFLWTLVPAKVYENHKIKDAPSLEPKCVTIFWFQLFRSRTKLIFGVWTRVEPSPCWWKRVWVCYAADAVGCLYITWRKAGLTLFVVVWQSRAGWLVRFQNLGECI